jgi:hypothetical protein
MAKLSSYSNAPTPLISDKVPITSGGATYNLPLSSLPKGITKTVATSASGLVADYICDGAADDVQLNAAIVAVNAAGGGIVLVKASSTAYDITASVALLSNVTLQGEGIGATVFKCHANTNIHMILIDGVSNVIIRDFAVDGNKANNASQTGHNIRIGHTGGASPVCDKIYAQNIYTHDAGLHGFITAYDSSTQNGYLSIINCRSDSNGVSSNGSGFYINGFENVQMSHCFATGNQLDGIQWKTSNYLNISNCHSHDNLRYGFFAVDGHANLNNLSSYSNGQFGFYAQGGGVFDPTNNTTINLVNAISYANGGSGVRLEDCDGCRLTNVRSYNTIGTGTLSGLRFVASTSNTSNRHQIVNCSFYDDQGTPTQTYGIWASGGGTIDKNLIVSNAMYGNSSSAFRQDTWGVNNLYSAANNITS